MQTIARQMRKNIDTAPQNYSTLELFTSNFLWKNVNTDFLRTNANIKSLIVQVAHSLLYIATHFH